MRDGLYRVVTHYFVAGFVIKDGQLSQCAPIIFKQFRRWKSQAKFVCE